MLTSNAAEMMVKELKDNGWEIFGFTPNQSDAWTDYWCPAYWNGVASKDGYVLLVNVYGTSYSGYKVKTQAVKVDAEKIQKLEATMNDAASTENEKAVCQKKIDEMYKKQEESTVVIEEYPTFTHATPKRCTWHIEKDGMIIAKGVGATDENLKRDEEKIIKLVKRFEKEIKNSSQLEAVQEPVKTVVVKPVEVTNRQTILVNDVLSFDYHGHYWLVTSVYTQSNGKKCATYELLGAASRGYQQKKNTKSYYDYVEKMEKNIEQGSIKIHTLEEVEEITYKTVYKKVSRKVEEKPAQEENLLSGEVSEVTEETTQENTATKRQRFALHMASKRTIDTREIVISKEKASELIGKSKQGEDITEELKVIAGIVEEVETVKEVQEEIIENEAVVIEEAKEDMNINMERLADTFTELVQEAGKRYAEMNKDDKVKLVNELTNYINNYEIALSEEDMKYLETNYPVLHLVFSSKKEENKTQETEFKINEKQLETLNKRLEKEHVKPLALYKDSVTDSIVLECVNMNLEEPFSFFFTIDTKGNEKGKGYDYQVDKSNLIRTYANVEKEAVKVDTSAASEITYKLNEEQNGVEIYFNEKPSEEVRALLKANKFRYSRRNCCWYSKQSDKTIELAKELSNGSINNETVTYEDINIDDCSSYTVSQELTDREHSANWVFRTVKKDHNKILTEHFQNYTDKVKEVISTTDNQSVIYKLKSKLQTFKKKYHEVYVKQLVLKSNNPSWATTGRAGRSASKHNKAMDRYDNLMHELIGLGEYIEKAIDSAEYQITKAKDTAIKNAVSNVSIDGYKFETVNKKTDRGNIRMYKLNGYHIVRDWTYIIFHNGKEVKKMKRTDKLSDAKQYVIYLMQNEKATVTA